MIRNPVQLKDLVNFTNYDQQTEINKIKKSFSQIEQSLILPQDYMRDH